MHTVQEQDVEVWHLGSESKLGASVIDQSQNHAGRKVVAKVRVNTGLTVQKQPTLLHNQ